MDSRGAVASALMCFVLVMQLIPAALYVQYFDESVVGCSVTCLALAGIVVEPLRAALDKAPQTTSETSSET